jgi:hypothetical protein
MEEAAGREFSHARSNASLLGWFLGFLLFYVASIGPAARLYYAVPRTQPVLEIIYEPTVALCGPYAPLGRALDWYIRDVWKVKYP